MERVLKAVPVDLRAKMEALVHDLASALEETAHGVGSGCSGNSSTGGGVRRRWGLRRRAQSAGSLPLACAQVQPSGVGRRSARGSVVGASYVDDSSSSAGGHARTLAAALRHSDSDSDEDEDEDTALGMKVSPTCPREVTPSDGCGNAASVRSTTALTGSGLGGCLSVLAALGPSPGFLPESDSLNENFSPTAAPHACARRKRKFKRMAVDSTALVSMPSGPPLPVPRPPPIHKRKARVTAALRRSNCENRLGSYVLLCGKRKRSARERSGIHAEYDALGSAPSSGMPTSRFERRRSRHVLALRKLSLSDPAPMSSHGGGAPSTGDLLSSSSLSSSESDAGLYTNDEGREGDDEQSDWVGGGGGWWEDYDPDDHSPDRLQSDCAFDAILAGSLPHMTEEAKANYRARVQGLRDSLSGREIRAGRRRLRPERPGFTVLTSANEKLSRFLQDSAQSELRLHPMQAPERAQLGHLAALYSLHMRTDAGSRPVLTKVAATKMCQTQDTMRAVRVDQLAAGAGSATRRGLGAASADFKRRRRLPPQQQSLTHNSDATQPMEVAAGIPPLSDTNVGCRLLRGMGWVPGQGLGPSGAGVQEPVTATLRPRHLGLGHSYKSS